MKFMKRFFWKICGMMLITTVVSAGAKEDALIDKLVLAYGGEALLSLKSLTLMDNLKRFTSGQSYSPTEVDLSHYNTVVKIDFENGRKELQLIGGEGKHIYARHQFYDGEKGYGINHTDQTVMENSSYRFTTVDRRFSLRIDALLVKLLHDNQEDAKYEGKVLYRGKSHEKISFEAEGYPKLTLYIDQVTGLITKMTRPHWAPNTEFSYVYTGHEIQDAIPFAKGVYVTKGGKPETLSVSRSLVLNPDLTGAFHIPSSYGAAPKSMSFTDMSVKELSEGVYLAGQDWGFSIFVDAGDHFVAVGGYEDLKKRLAAVQVYAETEKPLKYQIVTHHHLDHLGGMGEAMELGAVFVTVKEHVASIRAIVGKPIPDDRFILIDGAGSVGNDLVKLVDFPNGHASHNLVSYIPGAKTVFTADYFLSRQETGAPDGHNGLVKFKETLRDHNFDADYFAAAHSGRVLTAADLQEAMNNIAPPEVCPVGWSQCEE